MDAAQCLARPMARLFLLPSSSSSSSSSAASSAAARHAASRTLSRPQPRPCPSSASSPRAHSTTARTKRSIKVAPHPSFLPDRRLPGLPPADTIIYNPPASEASPYHTPFLFLPRNDPRRVALVRMGPAHLHARPGASSAATASTSEGDGVDQQKQLSPELRHNSQSPRSPDSLTITPEQIAEMKRLRADDPLQWSTSRLAKRFDCSRMFVSIAAPAPADHVRWLQEKLERRKDRWGPKRRQAREDRSKRSDMMYRGEI